LHGTGVRLGLVTNGEHWMLVDAPKGETTGYASWYASLWREEKITLQAFRSLLSMARFFGVSDDQTIEALLTKSASNQQEVTDQLGLQVRKAVEVLIQSLDKADQDHGRELLEGVAEAVLYESALTVMMRLVFLFCAEERELIPTKPFPVYEQNYSVSTISRQLREIADQHGEELLERRYDAWPRLLSAFRAVYGGLSHDDIYLPAYGGRLFDPDRFPFLEGRWPKTNWRDAEATPLPVNNRTVLHLLEALQLLQVKVPGGGTAEARRVSFRALDIEQIGHVYEGLLDHTAKRATEPTLGLFGKKEPEIRLQVLEQERAKGEQRFYDFLKKQCGSSRKWEKYLDVELEDRQEVRLRTACGNDESLFEQVRPFAGLLRDDTFGYPVVVPKGSVFVTAGTDRRSSGTHYTPRSLTIPIVQHTLEPLVYVGPAEGKPKSEWKLKSAAELLDVKICDMACGSGAFLVQAARYMSERLMEAWDAVKEAHPDVPGITPEGNPSTGEPNELLIPNDPAERTTYAMRIVAQRCLYGVDINPLAAEMAKLSLWLLTLAKDKPFEFLDHAIRCGDSLIGLHDIEQLRHFSLKPDADDAVLFKGPLDNAVDEAIELRLKLEDMPANTVEDVEAQEKLLKEADDKIARLRCSADLLVAGEFWGENAADKQERVRHAAVVSGHYVEHGTTEEFEDKAEKERRGQKMFHWPLEFPEVIVKRGGFDAFVGNPPFMGNKKITGAFGLQYREYMVTFLAHNRRGMADLCAYFFLKAGELLRPQGNLGLVATNTISQGETRLVGLDLLLQGGFTLYWALPDVTWPGTASVIISQVVAHNGEWYGARWLGSRHVKHIASSLQDDSASNGKPFPLSTMNDKGFVGSYVLGKGFVLTPQQASRLIEENPHNSQVVFPYLNGDDLNSTANQQATRWVINFFKWPLDRASAPVDYEGPVATEFPECLQIVQRLVKPERDKKKRKTYRDNWWRFGELQASLYESINGMGRVLVKARISPIHAIVFATNDQVFNEKTVVFTGGMFEFAALQSSIHEAWAIEYSPTMGTSTLSYSPTGCFVTFAYPPDSQDVRSVAERYYDVRHALLGKYQRGLTKLYNLFNSDDETSSDIQQLRDLHAEMDRAVAAAYGWDGLDLDHGFHETKQGLRFTISEPARREVLQRLLKLNHERYAEEVAQGLHGKKKSGKKSAAKKKAAKKKVPVKQSPALFDMGEDEES